MIASSLPLSSPLDDFLAGAGSETDTGELLQRIGLIGSLVGLTLAIGIIAFLVVVHHGRKAEVAVLLTVAMAVAALGAVGAVVEIAGSASVLDTDWLDALSSSSGSAAMLRLLGGLLIALGLFNQTVSVDDADDEFDVRWVPGSASAFGLVGGLVAMVSFGFDGHTVTEGPRLVHAIVNMVHVGAGSVWFGGVVALSIVSYSRHKTGQSVAPLVLRFSTIATAALLSVTLAGSLMALLISDGFGDFTGTNWGQMLIVKVIAVGIAVAVGAYNHFVVVYKLQGGDGPDVVVGRVRHILAIESLVLLVVAVLTVWVSLASTTI